MLVCIYFEKSGKYVKTVEKEGPVNTGKRNENILWSRKENLKGIKLHSVMFRNTEVKDEENWH